MLDHSSSSTAANALLTGRIVSLQVGTPRRLVTAEGRAWQSAITKESVAGPVALGAENFAGDYQADRKHHGGPDKAICGYSAEHYPEWRERFGVDLPFGAFGENLTVANLTEEVICIGDVFAFGSARAQISQPRMPCANISKRWNLKELPRLMEETRRTGFYMRVVETGEAAAGDTVTLIERPHPDWSVYRANELLYGDRPDPDALTALREIAALSAEWKRILGRVLRKADASA